MLPWAILKYVHSSSTMISIPGNNENFISFFIMERISTHCMQAKNSSLASLNLATLLYFVHFEKKNVCPDSGERREIERGMSETSWPA